MDDSHVEKFLALVTDGNTISDLDPPCPTCKRTTYGPKGAKRKRHFLWYGAKVLGKLKVELDVFGDKDEKGKLYITTNQGGQAISGDISLLLDWVHVYISHGGRSHKPGDFSWNYCVRRNEKGEPKEWAIGEWVEWEALKDIPTLAERIKKGRPK